MPIQLIKNQFIIAKKVVLPTILMMFIITGIATLQEIDVHKKGMIFIFFMFLTVNVFVSSLIGIEKEEKKGTILMCTLPYKRSWLVLGRYLCVDVLMLFFLTIFCVADLIKNQTLCLNYEDITMAIFIANFYVSLMTPIEYKFGYNVCKFVIPVLSAVCVFGGEILLSMIMHNKQVIDSFFQTFDMIKYYIPILIVLIQLISFKMAATFFEKKDF